MAAAITVTPTEVQVGDAVTVEGTGFLPNVTCTITIPEFGIASEVKSDASGAISSDDLADRAFVTLTSDATNVTADDTVTIGDVVYTFKAVVTTTADEVKIGANAAATLANLKAAVNDDTTAQANYGSDTVVNPTVGASTITATTLLLYARTGGTAGNDLVSTEASTHLSFNATTLDAGAASTGISGLLYTASSTAPFTVRATDGTSTVEQRVQVWSS